MQFAAWGGDVGLRHAMNLHWELAIERSVQPGPGKAGGLFAASCTGTMSRGLTKMNLLRVVIVSVNT
jgi:hypothetical protein